MNRQRIIAEIVRTAAENGGKPLGSKRFADVAGIREYDWRGKFWTRWSDALAEAGFAPNEMRGRFDDSMLLQRYADLAHELCALPTHSDLRLRHNQDPSFPDAKVFERFGTKGELVDRLRAFLLDSDQYPEVVSICEAYVPRVSPINDSPAPSAAEIGYVYLIRSGRFYKIGKSNSVGRREYELSIQLPERATLVHTIRTDDPAGIEAYWHKRFAGSRKNGEWFDLGAGEIAAFKRRRFQ